MISVVIPTIAGREHWLKRCLKAYKDTSPADTEFIVIHDKPACGIAWNEGIEQAQGDYIHLSADDLEPHSGWWQHAVQICDEGNLPAPRLLNSDGTLQACGDNEVEKEDGVVVGFTRVPFLSREQAETIYPVIETHYYTDVWVSEVGRCYGMEVILSRSYLFTHHFAGEGRLSDELLTLDHHACRAQFSWLMRDRKLTHPSL